MSTSTTERSIGNVFPLRGGNVAIKVARGLATAAEVQMAQRHLSIDVKTLPAGL